MTHSGKPTIALDAMGGDFAPVREIEGAILAVRASGGAFNVQLVGDEAALHRELRARKAENLFPPVLHASQVITMDDSPTAALKSKSDSSLAVAMKLHKDGKAQACVSAGNTGAVLSAATLILGRIEGVSRPTIGTFIPSDTGACLLVDAGANVDCRARHLFEFAVMGSIYFAMIRRKANPTVALLNVGEERTKGTGVVLEARELLEKSGLNFVGNVEGRDILRSKADVVVCDGFVGNIVLKFGESVPGFLKSRLKAFAERGTMKKLAVGIARWPLKASLSDLDPNVEGGVPVLGVNGTAIIGHGSSTAEGIKNMILRGAEVVAGGLNGRIETALAGGPAKTEGA